MINWQIYTIAAAGIATVAFSAGVGLTRTFYQAGEVDNLRKEIKVYEKADELKDSLIDRTTAAQNAAVIQYGKAADALVDMAERKPIDRTTVKETFKDAPTQYAQFDPKQCLSYIYPDGMFIDGQKIVNAQFARLWGDGSRPDPTGLSQDSPAKTGAE